MLTEPERSAVRSDLAVARRIDEESRVSAVFVPVHTRSGQRRSRKRARDGRPVAALDRRAQLERRALALR